ncbi:cdkn1a interacting zinc finger protein 1b isoform X3 [Archocentrus centrarchus]|uniref:cdkn1a interacting zinc finger protein 1b isoform X3 n=1 Tax=Archocentrus centrarchus TaxID=63155 RepID=UPI0011EA24BD|nr:cip1-interacting zinc finger protein-like isoform X3 [Archocentrus centrarchus]
MVKQPQRTDRCFLPAVGSSVARVRFPVSPAQRRPPPPQQGSGIGITDSRPRCSSTTTEEERGADGPSRPGAPGLEGGSVEPDLKRARTEGTEELAAPPSRDRGPGSCDPATDVPHLEQQGAADHSEGSRAAELFQEHMSGPEHVKKLQEITHSIHLNTRTLQDSRGCRPEAQRWCDTCQTHFSGDVIIHRQTKQHKMCKQLCRPFCPVCRRHFRTPRKFVEHMKSPEHKQQVHLEEAQEEELITVDAVGCFEEEEEEEEEQVVEEEVDVAEEEEDAGTEESKEEASEIAGQEEEEDSGEYDSNATYGRSFVVPVCGFVCQLCKKFFYSESAARRTHCRTHTHYLHLQSHRTQRRRRGQRDEEKGSAAPT